MSEPPALSALEFALVHDQSDAAHLAGLLGEPAYAVLDAHCVHPDPHVRVRVMSAATRVPSAVRVLAKGVYDPDRRVRFQAIEGLARRATREHLAMMEPAVALQTHPVDAVALIHLLGRIGDASRCEAYRARREATSAWQLCAAWTTTLARLGDVAAQREWLLAVLSAPRDAHAFCFTLLTRAAQPWIHPALALYLDDDETAYDYPHRGTPEYIRRCDAAVELAARVFAMRLPFATVPLRNFSRAECAQVRAKLPVRSVLDPDHAAGD